MPSARTFDTAASRWAGVGPYYAMFPIAFADEVIARYTDRGDTVLDPFAGRGTAVYSAAVQGRHGIGIELNPVGWVYGRTKLSPADKGEVTSRLEEIGSIGARSPHFAAEARALPTFFHKCFSRTVRRFLVTARAHLDWRRNHVDRTAMALILVNLHGKREASLSNQMRQTKAMSPDYSIAWWDRNKMSPPDVDPVAFMLKRLEWRYARGVPLLAKSQMFLGDNAVHLSKLSNTADRPAARLLLTSPPYFGLTNYHYDQWLRLWLLGGAPNALRAGGKNKGKFEHAERYQDLLIQAFRKASQCLRSDAVIYVRTGQDKVTRTATRDALRLVFPNKTLVEKIRPFRGPTQTQLFWEGTGHSGEVDQVMHP